MTKDYNNDYTIDEIKAQLDIVEVAQSYGLQLKKQGAEYSSLCCFHEERTPSLQFTPSNQLYHCKGCGAGGDVFTFVKEYENLDSNKEVVERLKELAGIVDDQGKAVKAPAKKVIERPPSPEEDWEAIMPVPSSAPKLMQAGRTIPVFNPKTNKETEWVPEPDGVYPYRDHHGGLLGAVLRAVIKDKKLTPTITYCANKHTGEERWIIKGFPELRPLYNTDEMNDSLPVLLVEGEKCVDTAHSRVKHAYSAITWPMGTNGVEKVDWSPLYKKEIIGWADNDLKTYQRGANAGQLKPEDEQSGRKAMLWIKKHLEANGSTVTLLDQPEDKPDGWDCADAVDEGCDILQYIADHMPVADDSFSVEEDNDPMHDDRIKSEIIPLGYDDGRFYYYSKFTNQIKRLLDKEHSQNALLGMAPIEWWASGWSNDKGKPDWAEATSFLMQSCRNVGIFDKKKIRGLGCWLDDNRFVLHLGDRLIVDGETRELGAFRSNYVYQAAPRKRAPSNPLSTTESKGLLEAAKMFDWEMPASGLLLAGFCVLAPICASLQWRPHVWVTGGSGTGKSTVFDMFIKQLIGDVGIYSSLESTSAGLTQKMGADGLPVIFEEFDPSKNKRADTEKAQGFFNLMRLSSDDSGIEIFRGSASGESVTYTINSMFCLIGIQICTTEQAILNRTAQLGLRSRANKTEDQKKRNQLQWDEISRSLSDKVAGIDNVSSRLLARTLSMIDIIQHNIVVFRNAANEYWGNRRYADQYGTLLAGAYSLVSDSKVKQETALAYIEKYDWSTYTEDTEDDESLQALQHILQADIKVETEGLPKLMNVAEAIDLVRKGGVYHSHAAEELARFGILCKNDKQLLFISNDHERIAKHVAGKPWSSKWGKFLKRIKGPNGEECSGTNAMMFARVKKRATQIPYSILDN